jgi:hypothetical protein
MTPHSEMAKAVTIAVGACARFAVGAIAAAPASVPRAVAGPAVRVGVASEALDCWAAQGEHGTSFSMNIGHQICPDRNTVATFTMMRCRSSRLLGPP